MCGMLVMFIGICYHSFIIKSVPILLLLLSAIPPGFYSFIKTLSFSKRKIMNIISAPSIKRLIRTVFSNIIIMIIVPTYIAAIIYLYFTLLEITLYTTITVIVAILYAIQILPLMIKKEIYTKEAKRSLGYARDEIKITRIILFDSSLPEIEREKAKQRHIAAEELMSVNSDYLIYSTSIIGTFIMIVRLILPIFTGIGGQLIRNMLGG